MEKYKNQEGVFIKSQAERDRLKKKNEIKNKFKGKDKNKLSTKEKDDLLFIIAEYLGLI